MKRTLFTLAALILLAVPTGAVTAQANDQTTLEGRIQARKESLKITLDAAKANRIKNSCKAAQGKLQASSKRIQGIRTSRSEVYNNLTARLNNAKDKLAESNIDTAKLDSAMTELADTIVSYKTIMTSYQSAIDDASVLDCQTDPEAFWLSISQARESITEIKDTHQQIKDHLKNSIKPELVELRKQLGGNSEGGEEQ